MNYNWPGNIRELQHFIERQVLITRGTEIDLKDASIFYGHELERQNAHEFHEKPEIQEYARFIKSKEQEYLVNLLEEAKGSIEKAANIAGIHRKTLYVKLKEHQLDKKVFKES